MGAHVGQRGYFEYERDGFGPVVEERTGAVKAISEALAHGGAPLPEYLERIESTFPHRDGGCSERVVQAVLASTRRDRGTEQVPDPGGRGPTVSRSVAVMGSCVTRDNFNSTFNPGYKKWFQVVLSANQTSLISLMSPPIDAEWQPLRKMSDYDSGTSATTCPGSSWSTSPRSNPRS